MKKFKEYLSEEIMPFAQTEKGFVGIDNGPVRDNINLLLANVTDKSYSTPYHALEAVRRVLVSFHIALPATNFLDGEAGQEVFQINQFGSKVGMTNDGQVVTSTPSSYSVYFEYALNDSGSFDIFCEVVDDDELEKIMADVEAEDDVDENDAADTFDDYKASNVNEEKKPSTRVVTASKKAEKGTKWRVQARNPDSEGSEVELRQGKRVKMKGYYDRNAGDFVMGPTKKNKPDWSKKDKSYASGKDILKTVKEERLDEVSRGLLQRYKKKADAQSEPLSKKYRKGTISGSEEKTLIKRGEGSSMAMQKLSGYGKPKVLAKEEAIDEVLDTPAKKQEYQDKANKSFSDNFGKKDAKAGHTVSKRLAGLRMSLKKEETENLQELSKKTLGSYIKKASHDVATKSAATGRYADRANRVRDEVKQGNYKNYPQGKKDDEFADKMFKKSWKRREGIAKATDKLTK